MDIRLKHPFTAILAGPTGCGKSVFTFKLITQSQHMIDPAPEKIIYCYGEYQEIFNDYPQVIFIEGLPDVSQFDGKQQTLLILDDSSKSVPCVQMPLISFNQHNFSTIIILTVSTSPFIKSIASSAT
jgi:hypothetical protein